MQIFLMLVMLSLFFVGSNWLMGYRKNYITIDLEERYMDYNKYIEAIQSELVKQGKEASYQRNGIFLIDGRSYIFKERNIPVGGVPLQRTILKPDK